MAAIHFVVVQAIMMMFSPLISFYYFFDSQSDAAEEGVEKELQEQRRRQRVGGTGASDADGAPPKSTKNKDGFEPVATEDDDAQEAQTAAAVAVAHGSIGNPEVDEVKTDQQLMKKQMEAKQIPHKEFFRKTRRVDKLFAKLYSRRKKLLAKLEDIDTNNSGYTSWAEWWYVLHTPHMHALTPSCSSSTPTGMQCASLPRTKRSLMRMRRQRKLVQQMITTRSLV
jgi:hypothetical protein